MNNDESLNPCTYLYIPELSITSAASGRRYIYMPNLPAFLGYVEENHCLRGGYAKISTDDRGLYFFTEGRNFRPPPPPPFFFSF